MDNSTNPTFLLTGLALDGGWTVVHRLQKDEKHTGGAFSVGYVVENSDGRQGFLKALDFYAPLSYSVDAATDLKAMTEAFIHERRLLEQCARRRLSKVVLAIDSGSVRVETGQPWNVVQYLIFELADTDVRAQLDSFQEFDEAWALRSLHNVAVGMYQLHKEGISHQDLKPSNVLLFADGAESKVTDLGRSIHRNMPGPHDRLDVPGAIPYAPPELLYNHLHPDFETRRFGADLYLIGSLISSYFTGMSMTALLTLHLPRGMSFREWPGTFHDVLPALKSSFEDSLSYVSAEFPEGIRGDLTTIVRQLCDPDPEQRGHPRNRASRGSSYSLERFVSALDRLARKQEKAAQLRIVRGN